MVKLPKPRIVKGKTFIVDSKSPWTSLGPHSYKNCEFQLSTTWRGFAVNRASFEDCAFVAKKPLKSFDGWSQAVLKNCRFTGTFVGNWFGAYHLFEPAGSVESCDFSGASLEYCRFHSCDLREIVFPKVHCLGVCNPSQHIPLLCGKGPTPEINKFLSLVPIEDRELTVYVSDVRELQKPDGVVPDELVAWLSKMKVPIVWQRNNGDTK